MSDSLIVLLFITAALIVILVGAAFISGRKRRLRSPDEPGDVERQIRSRAWDAAVRRARERVHS